MHLLVGHQEKLSLKMEVIINFMSQNFYLEVHHEMNVTLSFNIHNGISKKIQQLTHSMISYQQRKISRIILPIQDPWTILIYVISKHQLCRIPDTDNTNSNNNKTKLVQ